MPAPVRKDRGGKLPGADRVRGLARTLALVAKPGLPADDAPRTLPDFLILGASRCGTTSLYNYLAKHPAVAAASRKEIHYFDENLGRGIDWYRRRFPSLRHARLLRNVRRCRFVTGEATPYYLFHPDCARRIARRLPAARLVALLRNPIDRAHSDHANKRARGFEPYGFEEALERETERLAGEVDKLLADESYYSFTHHRFGYRTRGIYAEQIERYLEHFPREQLLVIRSEDLFADPSGATRRVTDFLGLSAWSPPDRTVYNFRAKQPMSAATRARLAEFYAPHNRRLEALLATSFDWDA